MNTMCKWPLFLLIVCISMQNALADRTDEFTIYGKVSAVNLVENSIEIVNGEKPRVFRFIHSTKIFSENKELNFSDLKSNTIVEIKFWHDGEVKDRNNIISAIYVIKR